MPKEIKLPTIDPAKVVEEIGDFVVSKVLEFGASGGAIGLSGGVDSTVSALCAKQAFDRYNKSTAKKLELVGYMLPSKINDPGHTLDGENVAKKLGIRYQIVDLSPVVDAYQSTNPETFEQKYQKGNMISRIRATVLNTKAMFENKLVLGTGNFDEDYGIGYYTLFGDGAVHISPIGALHKRLVKQIAAANGFEDIAQREPTAGLEPGQTDFGDLGYTYETIEIVILGTLQGMAWEELATHPQVEAAFKADGERFKKLFGKSKYSSAAEMVKDIKIRNKTAKSKSSLISPPIPKISLNF
jgi:NAD+ synthase